MDAKYGTFPKVLAAGSGIFAVSITLAGLKADFIGGIIVGSIVMLLWGGFLKLITFAFEPQYFRILDGSENRPGSGKEFTVQSLVDAIEALPKVKPAGRIIEQVDRSLVANARIISKSAPPDDFGAEQRKEDAAWAEMFRAL